MKHLKKFEQYEETPVNEGIFKSIKIGFLGTLALIVSQFLDPRAILTKFEELLDLFNSSDLILEVLLDARNNSDLTDVEMSKISEGVKELEKMRAKHKNIDSYKAAIGKIAKLSNLKNRNFMGRKIAEYQPKKLTRVALVEFVRKYKKDFRLGPGQYDGTDNFREDNFRDRMRNLDGE